MTLLENELSRNPSACRAGRSLTSGSSRRACCTWGIGEPPGWRRGGAVAGFEFRLAVRLVVDPVEEEP